MQTRTVGELKILLPELDPNDLDPTTDLNDDLLEARVDGAAWSQSQLTDPRLRSSQLIGVDLSQSVWDGGTIHGCDIDRTDFSGATLTGLTIDRCTITGSRFTGSRLTDTTLKDVIFEDCRLDYSTFRLVTATGAVAFTNCTLTNATWSSCRLPRIAMRSCQLTNLELESCTLQGADLRENHLDGIRTALANLHGITLSENQLPDLTNLTIAELRVTVTNE